MEQKTPVKFNPIQWNKSCFLLTETSIVNRNKPSSPTKEPFWLEKNATFLTQTEKQLILNLKHTFCQSVPSSIKSHKRKVITPQGAPSLRGCAASYVLYETLDLHYEKIVTFVIEFTFCEFIWHASVYNKFWNPALSLILTAWKKCFPLHHAQNGS